jgi:hypothetical protein
MRATGEIVHESIADPVGPEFMAPPQRTLTAGQFMPLSA